MMDCCACSLDMRRTLSMKPMLLVTSTQTQMTMAMDMGPRRHIDIYICCNNNTRTAECCYLCTCSWRKG